MSRTATSRDRVEFFPAVVCRCLDQIELEQFAGDAVGKLVAKPEHRAIDVDVGSGHQTVADAVAT